MPACLVPLKCPNDGSALSEPPNTIRAVGAELAMKCAVCKGRFAGRYTSAGLVFA